MSIAVNKVGASKIAMYLYGKLVVEVGGFFWGTSATAIHAPAIQNDNRSIPFLQLGHAFVSGCVFSKLPVAVVLRTICYPQVRKSIIDSIAVNMVNAGMTKNHSMHSNHGAVVVCNSVSTVAETPLERPDHIDVTWVDKTNSFLALVADYYLGMVLKDVYLILMGVWLAVAKRFIPFIVFVAKTPCVMYRCTVASGAYPRIFFGFSNIHSMVFYHTSVLNQKGI